MKHTVLGFSEQIRFILPLRIYIMYAYVHVYTLVIVTMYTYNVPVINLSGRLVITEIMLRR